MSNPYTPQYDSQSRRLSSARRSYTYGEDDQSKESVSKRSVEGPLRVGKARVPLLRSFGHGTSWPTAGLHYQQEAWVLAREQLSVVDSLNSMIKHNDKCLPRRFQESSSARRHKPSTDAKLPPAKRRKLAQTPSTSILSLAATSTSTFSSVPSLVNSNATQTLISPSLSSQDITNSSGQQPSSMRKVPLPRPPSSQLHATIVTPAATPTVLTPQSPTCVKAEPLADTLPSLPSLRPGPHPPIQCIPQHVAVKSESEPFVHSLPPNSSESIQPHEHDTSGTQRVHPVPANCRPGVQNWDQNRNQWMKVAVRGVKLRGLKVTSVKMLSDGLVIDWKRPTKSDRSSHSSSASTRITAPSAPPVRPSNTSSSSPSSARATQPSSAQPTPAASEGSRQAAARRELELEAVKRREEAASRMSGFLPTAPPPPPDFPPRFKLDTPTSLWETDKAKPAPQADATSPPLPSPNASRYITDTSTQTLSMSPTSSTQCHVTVVSCLPKPSGSAASSSRRSSAFADQRIMQPQDYSDDDHMHMDVDHPRLNFWPPLPVPLPLGKCEGAWNTNETMKASGPSDIPMADRSAVKTSSASTSSAPDPPSLDTAPAPVPQPTSTITESAEHGSKADEGKRRATVEEIPDVDSPVGPPKLISATYEGLQRLNQADPAKLQEDAL